MSIDILPYFLAMILVSVGVYGVVCKLNLIKMIVGVIILEYGVNLFLVLTGYRVGEDESVVAPILSRGADQAQFIESSVDPVPQALILTSIVIGLGLVALMTALGLRIYEKYETFDLSKIRQLRG